MTVLGYIVFTLYTCGIVGLGVLLEQKSRLSSVTCRKLTHMLSAVIWIICYAFFGFSIHWILLNGLSVLALAVTTFSPRIGFFEKADRKNSIGLFYFSLSTFLVALVCFFVGEELYLYTGIAYFCLSLGDGLAPITAALFKKHNPHVLPSKTLVGCLTVFLVSALATGVFSWVFEMHLSPLFVFSVAGLTCIAELYGVRGLDNLFIEFSVFGYLLLFHFGLASLPLQTVLVVCPFLAFVAVGSKTMTQGAGVCSFLLFALVGFFGGDFLPVSFIAALFAVSTVVAVVTKKRNKRSSAVKQAHTARKSRQIIAVGLFALISIGVYFFTDVAVFRYIFFLALTEQFADSMASDVGSLTKGKNVSIVTLRPIEKGISGGVSLLGTVSALVASFALMLLPLACGALSPTAYLAISALAFVGTLIDSVVGALFQALYRCDTCNSPTEATIHCDRPARLVKGFRLIDNVAVNYIAGFATCLLGGLLVLL